ncbi:MAG: hypothetical protein FDX18_05020 [Chlorobium sp.]|nr:MAG: hypothetical protein FDX18_05020 [Chlorobium sp.]
MEKRVFDDLVQSLKEAGDIAEGKVMAFRRFEVKPADAGLIHVTIPDKSISRLRGDVLDMENDIISPACRGPSI